MGLAELIETTLLSYLRENATTENMVCFYFEKLSILKVV